MKPNLFKVTYNGLITGWEDKDIYVDALSDIDENTVATLVRVVPIKAKFQDELSGADLDAIFKKK